MLAREREKERKKERKIERKKERKERKKKGRARERGPAGQREEKKEQHDMCIMCQAGPASVEGAVLAAQTNRRKEREPRPTPREERGKKREGEEKGRTGPRNRGPRVPKTAKKLEVP